MKESDLECLKVYDPNLSKIRLGIERDGGYVICDISQPYDCYLSCGVAYEESFTRDFINKYKLNKSDCYAFDGTINDYPWQYTSNIQFIRKNIGSVNDDNNTNLSFVLDKYQNIFLKIDIEGGEYPWITSLTERDLSKFSQIAIEFHGIHDDSWGANYQTKINCLDKLAKTHYLVHAHGNNHAGTTNGIPDVIELTYINKNLFNKPLGLNTTFLPIVGLDYPNRGNIDIDLDMYPFVLQI